MQGNTGLFLVSEQWQVFGQPNGINGNGVHRYEALTGLGVRNLADPQTGNGTANNQAITKGEALGFKLAEPMFGITIGLQHFHVHTPGGDATKKFAETAVVTLFNGDSEVLRVKVAATGETWHWDGSDWKAGLPSGWGGGLRNGNDVYATQNINRTLTFNRGESELVLTNRTGNALFNFDRVEVSADDALKIGDDVPSWATSGLFVRSIDVRPTGGNDLILDRGGRDTIMPGPDTGVLNFVLNTEEPSLSYYTVTDGDRIALAADNDRDTIVYHGGHGVDVITGFKRGGASVGGDLLRLHRHAGNWRDEVETIDFKDGSAAPVSSALIRAFQTNGTPSRADDIEDGAIVLVGVSGLVQGTDDVFVRIPALGSARFQHRDCRRGRGHSPGPFASGRTARAAPAPPVMRRRNPSSPPSPPARRRAGWCRPRCRSAPARHPRPPTRRRWREPPLRTGSGRRPPR